MFAINPILIQYLNINTRHTDVYVYTVSTQCVCSVYVSFVIRILKWRHMFLLLGTAHRYVRINFRKQI